MQNISLFDLERLARKQAAICKVFGSTRRVMIVWALRDREMTVTEIAQAVGASMQSASQHLRLMKDKGILTSRKDGQSVLYRIDQNDMMANCLILEQSPFLTKADEKIF